MTRRLWVTQGFELAVLAAFACAQPLFDLLGGQATFFVAHRTGAFGILVFAAVLLLGPPLILLAVVRAVSLASTRLGDAVHRATLGLLAGLSVAPPVTRALHLDAVGWGIVLAGVMVLTAFAHRRWTRGRNAVSWALVAPAAFVVMFLLGSPVRELVLPPEGGGPRAVARAGGPVVLLVLDELPLASLLRPDGMIDADRFPNFARLAQQSTFYPNATTNADGTVNALPALLTGRWLREAQLPTAVSHPDNLLNYVGRTYPMHASEFVTSLCAEDVCGHAGATSERSALWKDTAVVYLRATLPESVATAYVPAIGDRWTGFVDDSPRRDDGSFSVAAAIKTATQDNDEPDRFVGLLRQLEPAATPRLWYLHLGLPHVPWLLLPNGQTYHGAAIGGLMPQEVWQDDQRSVDHGLQRFLLQLAAVDRLLGQLLDRLHATGLDANALLVVVADHGASFRAGASRRDYDAAHASDILPIPLFIRYPGQRDGRRDNRPAELVDVVPTIADVLQMPLPWPVDGRSLRLDPPRASARHVFTRLQGLRTDTSDLDGRFELSRRIEMLFGGGGHMDDLFRMGPYRDLVGVAVAPSAAPALPDLTLRIDQPESFANVEPSSPLVPAMLAASIAGPLPPSTPVAVTLNEVVAGLGWTQAGNDTARLTVMLSPRFFRVGRNEVAIYRVEADRSLSLIGRSGGGDITLLQEHPDGDVSAVVMPDGRRLPVLTDSSRGHVERIARTGSTYQITGWSADPVGHRVPNRFLVTQRQRVVATSLPWPRDDVATVFNQPLLRECGVQVSTLLDGNRDIAVYALFEDGAYRMPVLP